MIKVGIRKILNQIQMHVSPLPQKAARYATHIWTSTNVDYEMVTRIWKRPASLMTDTGTFFDPTRHCVNRNPDKPFRLVWSGRHISRKELPIVLHALSAIGKNIQLTILGEGIETNRWKLLAKSLKLEDKIQWLGWLPRNEALSKMEEAHAFVFSSIREAASTVIMEALSLGLPVICHDACGMAIAINDTCGIKIPLHSPTESIKGFAAAITRLRDEPGLLSKLSKGALKRASELTWDSKAEEIARTYHGIVV
jgi:glycosyltransferase involved in cell wall biosynthesis